MCGYGRETGTEVVEFVPLSRLKVQEMLQKKARGR